MANTDRPMGFRLAKSINHGTLDVMFRYMTAGNRSSDTTNNHGDIYIGTPVKLVSGGILPANSGDTVYGVVCAIGSTGAVTHGDEGYYKPDALEQNYLAYNEAGIVGVIPAYGNLFEVQTASDLDLVHGSQADFSTDATEAHGSRTTGRDTCELVAASNNDVTVVEHVTTPDNDITLANAKHLVMFNDVANAQ